MSATTVGIGPIRLITSLLKSKLLFFPTCWPSDTGNLRFASRGAASHGTSSLGRQLSRGKTTVWGLKTCES